MSDTVQESGTKRNRNKRTGESRLEEQLSLVSELLTQQMNHWLLFPVAFTIMGCVSGLFPISRPDFLMWVCCGFLPVFTFFTRIKLKHFFPFLLCSLAVPLLCLVFPAQNIVCRVICVLCGIFYMVQSMVIRFRADTPWQQPIPPAVGIGISLLGILLLYHAEVPVWKAYFAFTLIGCFALYLLIYFMRHYLNFLSVNQSSSGVLPAAEMFHSGMGLVLVYTLGGTVLLLLGMNVKWLESFLHFLKNIILSVLRFLFSLFPKRAGEEEVLIEEAVGANQSVTGMDLPAGEPSLFWKALEYVAIFAFFCFLIFVIIRLFLRIWRFIRERFQLDFSLQHGAGFQQDNTDFREKCEIEKKASHPSEAFSLFAFLSPAEKIRKLYRKKLLKEADAFSTEADTKILSCKTARDAERVLKLEGMADIYERARYSSLESSAEDVRKMKSVLQRSTHRN